MYHKKQFLSQLKSNLLLYIVCSGNNLEDTVFFDELKGYDDIDNLPVYDDEPVENNNALRNSNHTKRNKNQQQCETSKGTSTLHIFWNAKKFTEENDEELVNEVINDESDNEIEDYNWHNKISAALKNLELDIKKENVKNKERKYTMPNAFVLGHMNM
ncbi:hypothetical protein C1646_667602 [Rhizophagus diaphanus]|nr:hypothetical protein C1646_667602 [Rhizophagus diaphanus] [Rhizophagus sp. MUCL 43196]